MIYLEEMMYLELHLFFYLLHICGERKNNKKLNRESVKKLNICK